MKAVITGDIVQSTKLKPEQRQALIKEIRLQLKSLGKVYGFKSEFFRGDSFQCLLNHPHEALLVALLLKTFIRSFNPTVLADVMKKQPIAKRSSILLQTNIIDSRIAIGIGEADIQDKLASSGGIAFSLSGHLLDEMKSKKQTFGIATLDAYSQELNIESILLDAIVSRTTALQCEVIYFKLLGYNETEIARELKIMQSAVNQRSRSGNWNAIAAMVTRFEEIYPEK